MVNVLVGARIRAIRKRDTGLSQEKFALEIGMDRTYFAGVESGKRNVSLINFEKILNGLGIDFTDFFAHGWDKEVQ